MNLLPLAFVVGFCCSVFAQTNKSPGASPPRTVLVTNWTEPSPDFRVVEGKVYNIRLSTNWSDICQKTFGTKMVDDHDPRADILNGRYSLVIKARQFNQTSILCDVYVLGNGEEFLKQILIYHHPLQDQFVTGQTIRSCLAMRVGNFSKAGRVFEAYDCGVRYTNKIPIVQRVKLP
jgi:hypothetical protein